MHKHYAVSIAIEAIEAIRKFIKQSDLVFKRSSQPEKKEIQSYLDKHNRRSIP